MGWPLAAGIIGSSLIGMLGGRSAAKEQNRGVEANARAQIEATKLNNAHQAEINAKNAALQREFAQHGIQWKVQDAQKAGLHPLAALGAQVSSATPSYVAGDPGGAARARGSASLARSSINAQARMSQALQMSTMMTNLAQAKYYDSLAAKNQVAVDTKKSNVVVGRVAGVESHPGVPLNEPVGTQRTYNLNIDSDVQNWEDKYGDIPGAFVGGTKLMKDYGQQLGLKSQITGKAGKYRVRKGYLQKLNRRGRWYNVRPVGQ